LICAARNLAAFPCTLFLRLFGVQEIKSWVIRRFVNLMPMKTFPAVIVSIVLSLIPGLAGAQTPTNAAPTGAEEKAQRCFQCNGTGKSRCSVPSCAGGQANCPAPCLKPNDGTWVHMNVAGHPPTDLWKKFPTRNGSYQAWNQNHAGELVQMKNGEPVNVGKCPTCGGSTKVQCSTCKGTGQITCPICDGKKLIPGSWSAFDNPKLKDRPTRFTLKDGRVIVGRKTSALGSSITIKTEKGSESIQASDVVSEEKPPAQK
jgi:hypothetical protein